jgi:hypothetical protein
VHKEIGEVRSKVVPKVTGEHLADQDPVDVLRRMPAIGPEHAEMVREGVEKAAGQFKA